MLAIPILLLVICLGVCRWARGRFDEMWSQSVRETAPTAHTGAEIARLFLNFEGVADVEILERDGVVTNYYDPARRRLFLSREVARGTHLAAWAVSLHEAGHAVQEGDALNDFKWRLAVIRWTRYGPALAVVLAVGAMFLLRVPGRFALMGLLAAFLGTLLLNLGTLSVEMRANNSLKRFLERHLARRPAALERLEHCLHRVATREVGDLLSSPRYFLFSAMPGTAAEAAVTKPEKSPE